VVCSVNLSRALRKRSERRYRRHLRHAGSPTFASAATRVCSRCPNVIDAARLPSALGYEIGYAREHGVVLCAHLSDDTVQRLQARRVARHSSPADNVTVDVSSIQEARRVVDEAKGRVDDASSARSIRLVV
jgi:hypothetical protein